MTVEVQHVRDALNDIDDRAIPDATIEQHLQFARLDLASRDIDDDDITSVEGQELDAYDMAIIHMAAYESFTSSPPQVQRSAIDASISWNIDSYIKQLERRKSAALDLIGNSEGGKSASIVDSANHLGL